MARSADPNSAGSQFFIVHKDSNFLDEQYTVFGRIVTEESFQTLDKIISVEIGSSDRPIDPEQVKITKAIIVNRSEISNILTLSEPERTQSPITPSTGNQKFESIEHGVSVSFPEGWLLQQPNKTQENSPDVVAVGPKIGTTNPVISLTIQQTNQKTMIELILEKIETLRAPVDEGSLTIISQEEKIINGNDAFMINAVGLFSSNNEDVNVQFREVMIYGTEKFYTFSYSNDLDNFNSQLSRFNETVDSFKELSKDVSTNENSNFGSESAEGGGCLIATAAFGSELAPQVQQLRELRDNTILQTESGTAFMAGFNQFYYSFSPVIADLERESPIFKEVVKITLTPMISTLSIMTLAEDGNESQVLGLGISVIVLNLGMYITVPAIAGFAISKRIKSRN
jgi:peptidyl-prolyl cis-trans isomerase B (cyclophilin B)